MKTSATLAGLLLAASIVSGCASMRTKVEKAPCGPTAGQTDPCGDRTPINTVYGEDGILEVGLT